MDTWINEMNTLAEHDPHHIACRELVEQREPEFLRIREKLTEQEQEALDLYIAACEELSYSRVYSAYEVGKKHSRQPMNR